MKKLLLPFVLLSLLAKPTEAHAKPSGVLLSNPNTIPGPVTAVVSAVGKDSSFITIMRKGKPSQFNLWGTHVTEDGHTVLVQTVQKGQKVTITPCPWKLDTAQSIEILKASGYEDENGEVPEFFVGKIALLANGKSGTFVTIRKGDTQLDFLLAGTRILQDGKTILGSSLQKGMTLKIYPTAWKPEQAQVIEVTAAASPTPIPGTTPAGGKKASSKTQ